MAANRWCFGLMAIMSLGPGCNASEKAPVPSDFRAAMRDFVSEISRYAKSKKSDFYIIPQNGHELLTENGDPDGVPVKSYLKAIDALGQESLNYGNHTKDPRTPRAERRRLGGLLDVGRKDGKTVLVTDYVPGRRQAERALKDNEKRGFVPFAADSRELDRIPEYPRPPWKAHAGDVRTLSQARNFLYLINPGKYPKKASYLKALKATDHDLIIMDAFYESGEMLAPDELESLRRKSNGGKRLVVAYMSIGEAEDYRYYWKKEYGAKRPDWMTEENPDWPGNLKVRYWDPAWKRIILGTRASYLDRILAAGFDGVYLDIIDAFEYFEENK